MPAPPPPGEAPAGRTQAAGAGGAVLRAAVDGRRLAELRIELREGEVHRRRRLLVIGRAAACSADLGEQRVGGRADTAARAGEAADLDRGVPVVDEDLTAEVIAAGAHLDGGGVAPVELGAAPRGQKPLAVGGELHRDRGLDDAALRPGIAARRPELVGSAALDRRVAAKSRIAAVGAGAVRRHGLGGTGRGGQIHVARPGEVGADLLGGSGRRQSQSNQGPRNQGLGAAAFLASSPHTHLLQPGS